MKQILLLTLVASLLALRADEPLSKLNGAFLQTKNKYGAMTEWKTRDSVTVIKVFRDGYWFGGFYDDKRRRSYDEKTAGVRPFNGACGGTYELKNGKYIEHIGFYSWDSTAIGTTIDFTYKLDKRTYEQAGVLNSEPAKALVLPSSPPTMTSIPPV